MMDGVERALIVDDPWISAILRGDKTWEMRKTACHVRGRIGLIRKGSGFIVGTAVVTASLPALGSREAYADAESYHRIPWDRQHRVFDDGWRTPWVIEDARAVSTPIPYDHPNGAVIWVTLQPSSIAAIGQVQVPARANAGLPMPNQHTASAQAGEVQQISRPPHASAPNQMPFHATDMRQITVSGGNLRNKHLYLPLDFFPDNAVGGGNKAQGAERAVMVTFDPGSTVETDLDGTKRMLRARAEVGDFLTRAGVAEGDAVLVIRTAPYEYTIRKAAHA